MTAIKSEDVVSAFMTDPSDRILGSAVTRRRGENGPYDDGLFIACVNKWLADYFHPLLARLDFSYKRDLFRAGAAKYGFRIDFFSFGKTPKPLLEEGDAVAQAAANNEAFHRRRDDTPSNASTAVASIERNGKFHVAAAVTLRDIEAPDEGVRDLRLRREAAAAAFRSAMSLQMAELMNDDAIWWELVREAERVGMLRIDIVRTQIS